MSILCISLAVTLAIQTPNLFPLPNSMQFNGIPVRFSGLKIRADDQLANERRVAEEVIGRSGYPSGFLNLRLDKALSELGAEGYKLTIGHDGVRINAPTSAGVFYGLQTLRQLIQRDANGISLPIVQISDSPRFPWRGSMLDVSRHFFPKADILHFLDLLSQYKINTFHWHLVDDGGWRLQIKKYPNLTQFGAWRTPSDGTFPEYKGLNFPGQTSGQKTYGGFYTQEDAREIVRYAGTRHITVVPEIEMPGHNLGATMSYPWLICSPKLKQGFQKETDFVWPNIFCAGKDTTFKFVEDVLEEVMQIFPSKTIHIGGDEVDKYLWARCDDCKARMKHEHLANTAQLESYFIKRVEKFVNSHGRHIIGWDEILEGGLAPNAYVMSWRGEAGGIEAAKQHHKVVMTPWDQCYFDHDNRELPIEVILGYDPAPPSRGAQLAKYVLGAQATIWTEHLPKRANIEDRLFPRILAMSQILWTKKKESAQSFLSRLDLHLPVLFTGAPGLHLRGPSTPLTVIRPGVPINLSYPSIPGTTARYTLDGSIPTRSSLAFNGRVTLKSGASITIGLTNDLGLRSETTQVTAWNMNPVVPPQTTEGLHFRMFKGAFNKVPDFQSLTSSSEGETATVKIVGGLQENYALEFSGYLSVPRNGRYTLYCSSDDGSYVRLGGIRIIDNDGPHGMLERSAVLDLTAGTYPMTVGYFQGTEGQQVALSIEGPGLPKQVVPSSLLRH